MKFKAAIAALLVSIPMMFGYAQTADTVSPNVTFDSTTSVTTASTTISGKATDNIGVSSVTWSNDKGGAGNAILGTGAYAGMWGAQNVPLVVGINTITVTAYDAVGNKAVVVTPVTRADATAPAPAPAPTPSPAPSPTSGGKVYYVDANAGDDSGDGSAAAPKKYITSGAALLSSAGGDTLIVKAGRYTNTKDALTSQGNGSATAWNTIKAEVDGSVVVTAGLGLNTTNHYLKLEGIVWDSPTTKSITGKYVKVLRSGFRGGPPNNNTMSLSIGTNNVTPGAEYVLVEDSYVYGPGGRYNVLVYNSDKVVLRRIVARHEAGWSDTKGDPQGTVALYNSRDVLTQNLLIVDSGAPGYFEAALYHPSNSRASMNIRNVGAIILNTAGTAVGWDDSNASSGNLLQDSVIYGASSAVSINGAAHAGTINRVTIAGMKSSGINDWRYSGKMNVQNSILWNVPNSTFKGVTHANNVCYNAASCSGEKTNINPAVSGLQWLPQIDAGSVLSTAGANGGQAGATVLYKLGVSGTLYGEPGYDQVTAESLWPWTNEAAIKKAMCTDAGVTTGFCAKASLTQYVWEMLGKVQP